jgi:hypothetical protein
MDSTTLMLSMLFGTFGMGFMMYGKKAGQMVPILAGLGLMLLPYFIANTIAMLIVCGSLTAVPFILRNG